MKVIRHFPIIASFMIEALIITLLVAPLNEVLLIQRGSDLVIKYYAYMVIGLLYWVSFGKLILEYVPYKLFAILSKKVNCLPKRYVAARLLFSTIPIAVLIAADEGNRSIFLLLAIVWIPVMLVVVKLKEKLEE